MGNCLTEEVSPMESTKLTTKRKGHARFMVQAMLFGTVKSLRVEVFGKMGYCKEARTLLQVFG